MDRINYRICTRCVMDTSDPGILFGDNGYCNRCTAFINHSGSSKVNKRELGQIAETLIQKIKQSGEGKEYDCIIGVSGGVDSTYVAYLTKQHNLRALAVHLDNGWNTTLAVTNIERCMKKLEIDLYTHVLNWEEFRDLQVSFLKASTPDSEIPTDHAIFALMAQKAQELGVKYILTGVNHATEGFALPNFGAGAPYDWKYIKCIHRKFGNKSLTNYPHQSLFLQLWRKFVLGQEKTPFLDYFDYNKEEAIQVIQKEVGWMPYSGKHHESIYTRFFQSYIMPKKFGFDKRRLHLSNLIMSGQLNRDQALAELGNAICSEELLREDKVFVVKKLALNGNEFENIMNAEPKTVSDYSTYEKTFIIKWHRARHASVFNSSDGWEV